MVESYIFISKFDPKIPILIKNKCIKTTFMKENFNEAKNMFGISPATSSDKVHVN